LCQRVRPRFGTLAVVLCCHAADAHGPNDFLVEENGHTPLDGHRTRQREDRGPVIIHQGLLKRLAGTFAVDDSLGFRDGDLDTPCLHLVQTLEIEQMPAVVHNGDDDVPRVLNGLCLSRDRQCLGYGQGESFFIGELRPRALAAEQESTQSHQAYTPSGK
jgi:hypothetical protein